MIDFLWKIKKKDLDKKHPNWLSYTLAQNRGLSTPEKLKDFLNPSLDQILKVKLSNIEKGKTRILKAIKNKEKMAVYSDYDADGLCATAIMWETLYDLGADIMPYVPHRTTEGYGLSEKGIEKLHNEGVKLIITVDNGVTAVKQVEFAKRLGVQIIITDHHVLPQIPPSPFALVHSTELCGAGVAWRFCYEIISSYKKEYEEKLLEKLELAALATIADLVPLLEGSRAIAKLGLEKLAQTKRPGLIALIKSAGITGKVGTHEIGHILAPRINAMGRIEHGLDSLRLLCAKNEKTAQKLAPLLSQTNTRRQDLTTKAIDQAKKLFEDGSLIGVIPSELWHEGIIGLVASRLVETHYRPMIVIARGEIYSKGSARSIPGFNIVEAIRSAQTFLIDGGGHPMAAGFTIETKNIELFKNHMIKYAQTTIKEEILTPQIEIECELKKEDITFANLKVIEEFEPYGIGNSQPLFLTRGLTIEDARSVGSENRHLKLQVDGFSAICFNKGEKKAALRPGDQIDLVYSVEHDHYNGNGRIQLNVRDLKLSN